MRKTTEKKISRVKKLLKAGKTVTRACKIAKISPVTYCKNTTTGTNGPIPLKTKTTDTVLTYQATITSPKTALDRRTEYLLETCTGLIKENIGLKMRIDELQNATPDF